MSVSFEPVPPLEGKVRAAMSGLDFDRSSCGKYEHVDPLEVYLEDQGVYVSEAPVALKSLSSADRVIGILIFAAMAWLVAGIAFDICAYVWRSL